MMNSQTEEIVLDKKKVEIDFLHYLNWFYREENSEEIERVIALCDGTNDNEFEREWSELEEQEAAWFFIDLFALDIRSMLVAIVAERRLEEQESAKEQIDRTNDLRGL